MTVLELYYFTKAMVEDCPEFNDTQPCIVADGNFFYLESAGITEDGLEIELGCE